MSASESERKLTAILMADAVGYSRLMGEDDSATVEAIDDARRLFVTYIGRFHGRLVNAPGDSILAEFGSVVDAVSAAVEIQRELAERNEPLPAAKRMEFRIGINLGDVIVKDEALYGDGVNIAARLESLAAPGGICISGTAHGQVEKRLPLEFKFLGKKAVKNIDRPVPVYRVLSRPGAAAHRVSAARIAAAATWRRLAVAVLVLTLLGGGGFTAWWVLERGGANAAYDPAADPLLRMPQGPTIAVLPFENLSGDPEQEYFSDGLTEQIIADLTLFRELHVLARNSTYQYKGRSVDVRSVREALGADYVIEGSVRRGTDRVRVTAQLIDAEDGRHVWAETYDRDLTGADLLDIQGGIASQVVATLGDYHGVISGVGMDLIIRKEPHDLGTYECYLRFLHYYRVLSPDEHLVARRCAEAALKQHAENADIRTWLAFLYLDEVRFGFNPGMDSVQRALELAHQAVKIDRANPLANLALVNLHFFRHDLDEFLIAAERALGLNPNQSTTMSSLGFMYVEVGMLERGKAMIDRAEALNPQPPGWHYFGPLEYHYARGEYAEAVEAGRKINMPDFYQAHGERAAALAQLGRMEEAREAIAKTLELNPDFEQNARREINNLFWGAPDQAEHWLEGLRKAGLKIPEADDGYRKEAPPPDSSGG